jgi:hypothetical protein
MIPYKRNPPPLKVSCTSLRDEGPNGYIDIKKTINKFSETKGNSKKTNQQKQKKNNKTQPKIKIK